MPHALERSTSDTPHGPWVAIRDATLVGLPSMVAATGHGLVDYTDLRFDLDHPHEEVMLDFVTARRCVYRVSGPKPLTVEGMIGSTTLLAGGVIAVSLWPRRVWWGVIPVEQSCPRCGESYVDAHVCGPTTSEEPS